MRHRSTAAVTTVAAALVGLLAGCAGGTDTTGGSTTVPTEATTSTAPSTPTAPEGLPAFYAVPDPLPAGQPGDLIAAEPVAADGVHGTVWRVMSHSQSVAGDDIAVTGMVAVPPGEAPSEGWPVVSWAHGTTGIADSCAPSLDPDRFGRVANGLLDAGYVVAATDYEGLGTPGRHPYLVGESEGRGVVDIVTAAIHVPEVHAGHRYAVWGHSQGGHAALYAGAVADRAPDLELVGVVAGAPPSRLRLMTRALGDGPFSHFPMMMLAGTNAAYGKDAPLDEVLTPLGIEALGAVDTTCSSSLGQVWSGLDPSAIRVADPAMVPSWASHLDGSDPTQLAAPIDAPLLLVHGATDGLVRPASSEAIFEHLCALGQVADRWLYPDEGHVEVVAASYRDMVRWIGARFAGDTAPEPVVPQGPPTPTTESCPPP